MLGSVEMVPVEHGFLKVVKGREFFVDTMNGEVYAYMPELQQFGDFELACIGGYLCTRTKRLYEVSGILAEVELRQQGLYLRLPYDGEPEGETVQRMLERRKHYEVCLLNGDESGVYWLLSVFEDGSPLVMDEEGNYYRVVKAARSRRAVKVHLGRVRSEADRVMMIQRVRELEEEIAELMRQEEARAKRKAARERVRLMQQLATAEPLQIGKKWGLRQGGRIIVPPIYRAVKAPVGRYCAFEKEPGQWGVLAVDGQVEVAARYEQVVIHPNGTVELTVVPGKVIRKRLSST